MFIVRDAVEMGMTVRKIVSIYEERCNGCGLCIPNCAEGALKIIDGKAKLVSDQFCDGLGACLGHCPQDAIRIVEREADKFDKEAVDRGLTIQAEHGEKVLVESFCGCPGSTVPDLRAEKASQGEVEVGEVKSELRQWPIKLRLVPPRAPYFQNSEVLIAADCAAFTYGNFHREFLKGRVLIIGCPKFDDAQYYLEKLTEILKSNEVKSIALVNMEVPCCFGLQHVTEEAIRRSGKAVPLRQTVITAKGEKLQ